VPYTDMAPFFRTKGDSHFPKRLRHVTDRQRPANTKASQTTQTDVPWRSWLCEYHHWNYTTDNFSERRSIYFYGFDSIRLFDGTVRSVPWRTNGRQAL